MKKSKGRTPVRHAKWGAIVREVRELARSHRGGWGVLAEDARVTYRWLGTFVRSEVADEDVRPEFVMRLARVMGYEVRLLGSIRELAPGESRNAHAAKGD